MIQQEIIKRKMTARKAKDGRALNFFTFLQGEFERVGKEVDNIKALKILNALSASYKDRIDYLTEAEQWELTCTDELIKEFTPTQLSEDEIKFHITQTLTANVEGSKPNLGQVQKFFKENFAGQYDAKRVTELFKELQ